ncbi:MAG: glycosyltransferase, partial [bacterium]
GLDLEMFNGNHSNSHYYKPENGEVIIGNAARFSEEKGHPYLFDLAYALKNDDINFKLLLAGTGKLEMKYKKQVESMQIDDKVEFLGFIEDIKLFNENIDIFVLTSEWEGFGYVMVEAMAAGKPVVAFDIRSSAEIVENGKTGYLVKKGDINELVLRVKELIRNKGLRDKFGQEGKIRVEKYFNINKTLIQFEDLLKMR